MPIKKPTPCKHKLPLTSCPNKFEQQDAARVYREIAEAYRSYTEGYYHRAIGHAENAIGLLDKNCEKREDVESLLRAAKRLDGGLPPEVE